MLSDTLLPLNALEPKLLWTYSEKWHSECSSTVQRQSIRIFRCSTVQDLHNELTPSVILLPLNVVSDFNTLISMIWEKGTYSKDQIGISYLVLWSKTTFNVRAHTNLLNWSHSKFFNWTIIQSIQTSNRNQILTNLTSLYHSIVQNINFKTYITYKQMQLTFFTWKTINQLEKPINISLCI